MLAKWEANEPYYLFFNKLARCSDTHEQLNAVSFTELICPSMGTLKCSLHITNNVDVFWLMKMYTDMRVNSTPITLLYGTIDDSNNLDTLRRNFSFLTFAEVDVGPLRLHNSKMSIFKYQDNSVRVVVSTADLIDEDWTKYNNGLWISPACPPIVNSRRKGESRTYFKSNLIYYLNAYHMDIIDPWVETVQIVDFSSIKVFLIASIPGKHQKGRDNHVNVVANLLKKHCHIPEDTESSQENSWSIIGQAPFIGKLGQTFSNWLKLFVTSMSQHRRYTNSSPNGHFDFIYPSQKNIEEAYRIYYTTPYTREQHEAQRWFQMNMHAWKADLLKRTKAMPRIKCYTRMTPCLTRSVYFLLTSADLSQNGWGYYLKTRQIQVKNWELGVLFLPSLFGEKLFEINVTTRNRKIFPMIYDLPLMKYIYNDEPWFS